MMAVLFVLTMSAVSALGSLYRPVIGVLGYVFFAVLRPASLWFYSLPDLNYSRIIAGGMLIGWALQGFGRWRFGRAAPIVYSLLGFWVWAAIRSIGAPGPDAASAYLADITKIVLPFVVAITVLDSFHKLRWLIWSIVVAQGYLALEFNRWYFSGVNRLAYEGFGGMDNNSNGIALVTCVGLCVFIALYESKLWLRCAAFGSLALIVHSVLFSFSRGAMISLVVSAIVIVYFLPRRPIYIAGVVITIVGVAAVTGPEVMNRFTSAFASEADLDQSAKGRLELWRICVDIMLSNPLGIGSGQFPVLAPRYGLPPGRFAHSFWLQTGSELGFPGLVLIVCFYGLCVARLWKDARPRVQAVDRLAPFAARMVIASLLGFSCAAQFVSLYALEPPYYVALIGAITLKLIDHGRSGRSGGLARLAPAGTSRVEASSTAPFPASPMETPRLLRAIEGLPPPASR
jgi:probable O-glycosylation ligase (exosortase A-associated)